MTLTKTRLRTHTLDQVAYCLTCRHAVDDALERDCPDDEVLRCTTCGDRLELAVEIVSMVDTSGIDMPKILADLRKEHGLSIDQLPDDAMTCKSITCSCYEVVGADDDETRPL